MIAVAGVKLFPELDPSSAAMKTTDIIIGAGGPGNSGTVRSSLSVRLRIPCTSGACDRLPCDVRVWAFVADCDQEADTSGVYGKMTDESLYTGAYKH